MASIYCVKCKSKTATTNPHPGMVNGRRRVAGTCAQCGTKKSQFIAGKGFFGNLAKSVFKKVAPTALNALTGLVKNKVGSSDNKVLQTLNSLGASTVLDNVNNMAQNKIGGLGLHRAGRIRLGGRVRIPGRGARRIVMRY